MPGNGLDGEGDRNSSASSSVWRVAIAAAAAMLLIGAVILVLASLRYHQVVTVTNRSHVKTTVTGPPGPHIALTTVILGAGVVLLLVAAYFNSDLTVGVPGLFTFQEVRQMAFSAAHAAQGDPAKTLKIIDKIAPQVATASQPPAPR